MRVGVRRREGGEVNSQRARSLAVFSQANAAQGLQVTDNGATCTDLSVGRGLRNARLQRPSSDAAGTFTVTWQCVFPGQGMLGWGSPTLGLTDAKAHETSGSFVYTCNGKLYGIGTKELAVQNAVQATNRAGVAMAPGSETGLLYCGRRLGVFAIGLLSNGQCGPTNGPQCPDCKAFYSEAIPPHLFGGAIQANETLSLIYRPGAAGASAGTLHASRQGAAPQLIFSRLAHDLVPVACFADGAGGAWRVVGA
jgi:hypothetical protein